MGLVMVDSEHACPLRDYLEADCKNLVALVNRMKDRCWADHWDAATGEEMDLNPHIPKPEPPAEPEKVEEEKKEEPAEEKKEEEAKPEKEAEEKQEEEKEKDEGKEKETVEEKKEEETKEEKESEEKK